MKAVATLVLGLIFITILFSATSELIPRVQDASVEIETNVNVISTLFSATGAIIIFIVASCFILALSIVMKTFLGNR